MKEKVPTRINSVDQLVDFSGMTEIDEKEFCKRVIADQLNLLNRLIGMPSNEHLVMEHVALIHLFKNFNVKTVARKLFGVMNWSQMITEFLKVMDEMC